MGIEDYIVDNDKFEAENSLGLYFPCCVCVHKNKTCLEPPCKFCGHNLVSVDE
jgi:hypothetical protein